VGFDNSHGMAAHGSRFRKPDVAYDLWHHTATNSKDITTQMILSMIRFNPARRLASIR
jgi:hypothetical protein